MIVTTMSFKEIFDSLNSEAEKVKYRLDAWVPRAKRSFQKIFDYPAWQSYEYTTPSTKNKHIMFYYAYSPFGFTSTTYCIVLGSEPNTRYIIKCMEMGYKYPDGRYIMLPQVHIYTSHFFKRYNERFLHNEKLSANEIAGIYFARNPKPTPLNMNENINTNYKQYGEFNEIGVRVNDGFCFTRTALDCEKGVDPADKVLAMGLIYTTFMNELAMTESQRDAINKEHIETLERCYEK